MILPPPTQQLNRAAIRSLGRQGRQHPNQPRGKFLGHGPWFSHQSVYVQKRLRRQAGAIINQRWALARQQQKEKNSNAKSKA